jgi:acyl-CoA reductase-like NAD-dependent aldehyde dehydrogenase
MKSPDSPGRFNLPKGEVLASNLADTHSIGMRRPLGVVASFTPWNGANILASRAVLNPLAAGNTMVVKPLQLAAVSAADGPQIAEEAGFPPGVINVVPHAPGAAGAIADEFCASDLVRCINLIGGVKTAKMLARRASRRRGGHRRAGRRGRQPHPVRVDLIDSGRRHL